MKKIVKKNQVVIAALAGLLAVAGYISFLGDPIELSDDAVEASVSATESAFAETDMADAAGEITIEDIDEGENIELNSDEENIGEAVLTSTDPAMMNMVNMKLSREQVRSKNKESYLEIINNDGMDEAAISSATDAYIKMTGDLEKEMEAETLLMAKGFTDAMVSISDESVDVIVGKVDLSDTERAQIEDIVLRKTGCSIDQIVITSISQ